MYNYFFIIGRLCEDVELKKTTDGKKFSTIRLAVNRPFKNSEGTYDTDFLNVTVFDAYCDSIKSYLKKGSSLAVKGRIALNEYVNKEEKKVSRIELIGERVMFVSGKTLDSEKEEDLGL